MNINRLCLNLSFPTWDEAKFIKKTCNNLADMYNREPEFGVFYRYQNSYSPAQGICSEQQLEHTIAIANSIDDLPFVFQESDRMQSSELAAGLIALISGRYSSS